MSWDSIRLSEIADIAAGQGAPQKATDYSNDGVPFVKAGDLSALSQGAPESSIQKVTPQAVSKYKLKLYPKDTVLFAKSGMSCMKGIVYQLLNDAYVVSHLACVTPRKVDGRFLKYYFYVSPPNALVQDEAYPSIRLSDIGNMMIPYPSLDVQKEIADTLDKIISIISKRKEQLALLDKLAQDTFVDMFGDPLINPKGFEKRNLQEFYLGGKSSVKCGPFGSALKKEEYTETGVAVWTMDNITKSGEFIDEAYLRIPESKYEQLLAYSVENGDVIISRAGTVGKMCVVSSVEPCSIISTNLIRVRFNEELLPLYFVSLMTYCGSRVARLKKGADGAFTHMNTGVLNSIDFPYPPIELQNEYRQTIAQIEKQKQRLQVSLAEMENTYQSILQRAFNGQLF